MIVPIQACARTRTHARAQSQARTGTHMRTTRRFIGVVSVIAVVNTTESPLEGSRVEIVCLFVRRQTDLKS